MVSDKRTVDDNTLPGCPWWFWAILAVAGGLALWLVASGAWSLYRFLSGVPLWD